jgi:hypothetical protein
MFKSIVSLFAAMVLWPALSDANVQVRTNLKLSMIVSEQGTRVSQSGGFRCSHRGRGTRRKTINNTWHQVVRLEQTFSGESFAIEKKSGLDFEAHPNEYNRILSNLPPEPLDPRQVQPENPSLTQSEPTPEEIEAYEKAQAQWEALREQRMAQFTHGSDEFRTLTISGGTQALPEAGHRLTMSIVDKFSADRDNNWNSRCWRAEANKFRHEANSLDGWIHVTYQLPEESQFLKLELSESSGILIDRFLERIDGSLVPGTRLTNEQYLWVLGDSSTSQRRVTLRFRYAAHTLNAAAAGIQHSSGFSVNLIPLQSEYPEMTMGERLLEVARLLAEGESPEAILIPELAPLIEQEVEVNQALSRFTLREIRQFQDIFLSYALRVTQDGQEPKSPFVKAMVAVVATRISENLSVKLLPVCIVETTTLPVLRKQVQAQRYVFMMFYLQRIIDRLKTYDPSATFAVVNVMQDQQSRGLTYQQVSQIEQERENLSRSYEIFMNIAQVQQQPARISGGEFQELTRFAEAFVSTAEEYQPILGAMQEAMGLEHQIYRNLQQQKRAYTRSPEDNLIEVSALVADIERLGQLVRAITEDLDNLIQNHLFSEVDVTSFSETMFRVFEGLNLISGDHFSEVDVRDYYTPIFNHFFDAAELARLSEQAQLCLSGQLEEQP